MDLKLVSDREKNQYNKLVTHVMQSWQWGQFRKKLGLPLLRFGLYQKNKLNQAFQLTLHKIPFVNLNVGYLPKGPFPDKNLARALKKIGRENNCAFIKVEPNVTINASTVIPANAGIYINKTTWIPDQVRDDKTKIDKAFLQSPKPLFTRYNFVLDLTKSEEEILQNMHPKFRYNIKVAQKHGVWVEERVDDEALEIYLKLYFETTKRQNYLGHNPNYHRLIWNTLKESGMTRLLIAFYSPPGTKQKIPLSVWMLLNFKNTLYYPYGGSSNQYKNVMASNLLAWEAVKFGKKLGLKKFDLWGAAAPNTGENDPWQGFTRFKKQLGADPVEYIGAYDLVFNWPVYLVFTAIDRLKPLKLFFLKVTGR